MKKFIADIIEAVSEQFQYRELLWQMTRRDIIIRYKQAAMGFGWAVFMPLINTAVFSIIFTQVAKIDTPVAYPVYAYCGLLFWNFFSSSLRFSVTSLVSNINLVTKIYFPREIFPFSAVIVCLIDAFVGAVVLVVLMMYYHIGVGPSILLFPVVLLVHVAFTAAIALIIAMANLFYRDVKYVFEFVLSIWMYLTPILYPLEEINEKYRLAFQLNPMTYIIDAYHNVLLLNKPPEPISFVLTTIVSLGLFVVCWQIFHRTEFKFAENI
ncbi:MAG: ABC transporter permease [Acidobacteriota bacterium]|nr:ABC transporter permease [Acidobacteriota bacterium]